MMIFGHTIQNKRKNQTMKKQLTAQEALIYVMVTTSAVDNEMRDEELRRIDHVVTTLPVFNNFNEQDIVPTAEACAELLGITNGLEIMLGLVKEALPNKLYETAYALAFEIAAVDLDICREEESFLNILQSELGIDNLATTAIERGAKARHMVV